MPSLAVLIRTLNGKCPSLRCHAISSCLGVKVDGREEGICSVRMGQFTGSWSLGSSMISFGTGCVLYLGGRMHCDMKRCRVSYRTSYRSSRRSCRYTQWTTHNVLTICSKLRTCSFGKVVCLTMVCCRYVEGSIAYRLTVDAGINSCVGSKFTVPCGGSFGGKSEI